MIARITQSSQALITVIAVLYGIGILVANLHLAQLGYYEFGVLRARYVAVGLAFVLLASLQGGVGFAVGFEQYSAAETLRGVRSALGFLLAAAVGVLMLALVGLFSFIVVARPFLGDYASLVDFPNPFGPPSPSRVVAMAQSFMGWYVLVALLGVAAGFTARDQRTRKWSAEPDPYRRAVTNAFVTVIMLANLAALLLPAVVFVVYATVVYPRLPAGFGGGAPIPVAIAAGMVRPTA